jgi:hypothetical protein
MPKLVEADDMIFNSTFPGLRNPSIDVHIWNSDEDLPVMKRWHADAKEQYKGIAVGLVVESVEKGITTVYPSNLNGIPPTTLASRDIT